MKKLLALAFALALSATNAWAQCSAIPALPDTERRTEYTGVVSSAGPFNISFQLYGDGSDYANWIEVWVNGVKKTGTVDYTVTSPSGAIGSLCRPISNAQVTFGTAQTGTIEIVGARRPRRTSQLSENRGVTAHDFNQLNSDLVAVERELWDLKNRMVLGLPGDVLQPLPSAATRASGILGFDATGLIPTMLSSKIGLGTVIGPNITVSGNLVSWNSTNGTTVADSGIPAANVAFLSGNNIWTGNQYFKSGAPWVDVKAFGAVGNGIANDTTAVQNAINSLSAGGIVNFPPGTYCLNGGITVSTNSIKLTGSGGANQGTVLSACNSDVTVVTLNAGDVHFENFFVTGKGLGATQPAAVIGASCVECYIAHNRFWFGSYALKVTGSDNFIFDNNIALSYGSAVVYMTGANFVTKLKADGSYPVSAPSIGTAPSAWTNAHAYTTGNIVSNSGYYIQVTNNCTSGAVAPTNQNYSVNITDNTCIWKLVAPTTQYAFQADTGVTFLSLIDADLSGPYTAGFYASNSLAGTAPQSLFLKTIAVAGAYTAGIWLHDGAGVNIDTAQIVGCVVTACAGILTSNSFSGELTITNSLIFSNPFGVNLAAGSNTLIENNTIVNSSSAGIVVQATISQWRVIGNNLGSSATWGANAIGVQVLAGASDYYTIAHNNMVGAGTEISDSGTGTHRVAFGNGSFTHLGFGDAYIGRGGTANIRLGLADAASAVAQTLSVQNVLGGTANTAGADWTIAASRGTGTGVGGNIKFQVAPAGGAGSSQNALADVLQIYNTQRVNISPTASAPDSLLTLNANTGPTTVAPVAGTSLHMVGADGVSPIFTYDGFGAGTNLFLARQATTSRATPGAAGAGQSIFSISAQGYDGVSAYGTVATIDLFTLNATSTTDHSGYIRFRTVASGAATTPPTQVGRIMQGWIVGAGTTDPGLGNLIASGTIEATGVFRNNGNAGLSVTKTVRASGGAADCTLIYTGGILTGGTC